MIKGEETKRVGFKYSLRNFSGKQAEESISFSVEKSKANRIYMVKSVTVQ